MDGLSQGTLNLENIQRVHNSQVTKDEELMSRGHSSSFESSSSDNANGTSEENNETTIVGYYDEQGQFVTTDNGGEKVKVEDMENSYVQLFFGSLGNY